MTKERLYELLKYALAFIDLKLLDDENSNGGCSLERILEQIDMTEEEYELILSGDLEDEMEED